MSVHFRKNSANLQVPPEKIGKTMTAQLTKMCEAKKNAKNVGKYLKSLTNSKPNVIRHHLGFKVDPHEVINEA